MRVSRRDILPGYSPVIYIYCALHLLCDSLDVVCPRLSSASASASAERRLYEYRLLCANRRSLSRHTLPTAACVKIPEPQSLKWLFDGNVQRDAARSAPSSETAKARSECTYKGPPLLAFTTFGFGAFGDDLRGAPTSCVGRTLFGFHLDQARAGESASVLSERKMNCRVATRSNLKESTDVVGL